jgi:hypothetical protein
VVGLQVIFLSRVHMHSHVCWLPNNTKQQSYAPVHDISRWNEHSVRAKGIAVQTGPRKVAICCIVFCNMSCSAPQSKIGAFDSEICERTCQSQHILANTDFYEHLPLSGPYIDKQATTQCDKKRVRNYDGQNSERGMLGESLLNL